MAPTHKTIEPKGLLSLWVAFLAVVAVVAAGLLSPLSQAYADSDAVLPSTEIGDITQGQSGNGKQVLIHNGTKFLYDNNGTLECKAPGEDGFDASKTKFTLSYVSTSAGSNKNQQITDSLPVRDSADHYNVIGASGNHLTMGNEDNNIYGNVKLSLRDTAFLSATNVDYRVNTTSQFAVGGWKGMGKIYSDRFSSNGVQQWFGLNADRTSTTLSPKGLSDASTPASCGGTSGFTVYNATYTVTYKDYNGTVLQGPTTVEFGDAEPSAPANPTRPADDEYVYTFKEWVKTYDEYGNITYTASYDQTPKPSDDPTDTTTTIDVHDEDGKPVVGAKVTVVCGDDVVETYTIAEGDEDKVVTLPSDECTVKVDAPDGYEDPDDTPVNPGGDTEVIVKKSTYTVTYKDWNGDVLQGPATVKVGDAEPAAPADPTRDADATNTYVFAEWLKDTDAGGNITYTASYDQTPKPSDDPTDTTTTIDVHDEDGKPVVGAKVTVVCGDDVVETYTIAEGDEDKVVTLPSDECTVKVDAPDGYEDPDDTPVNPGGDTEVIVKKSTYTVTYKDWNGDVLQGPATVKVGDAEPAAPADPTRPDDATNTYAFKEWVKSTDADGNVTYKADYTATPKPTTTVVVNDEDGKPIAGAKVTVVCDGKEVASYTTDGTEDKTVVLEPGECVVQVDAPEGYDDPADKPAVPGGDTEFTVEKTKQNVTVQIVDSEKPSEKLDGLVDIYDSEGNPVAEGVKSGDTVKLPAGDYTAKQSGDIAGYNKAGDESFTVTNTAEIVTLKAKSKPSEVTITVTDKINHEPVDVTAEVNCDGVSVPATVTNGKVVFNADTGQCTVTLTAENYEPQTITVEVPGKGEPVVKSVELTSKTATRPDSIDGTNNGNKNLNNAVPYNPAVKALTSRDGYRDNGMLARTGGAVGIGLAVAVLLLVAGVFLLAKRRTEN